MYRCKSNLQCGNQNVPTLELIHVHWHSARWCQSIKLELEVGLIYINIQPCSRVDLIVSISQSRFLPSMHRPTYITLTQQQQAKPQKVWWAALWLHAVATIYRQPTCPLFRLQGCSLVLCRDNHATTSKSTSVPTRLTAASCSQQQPQIIVTQVMDTQVRLHWPTRSETLVQYHNKFRGPPGLQVPRDAQTYLQPRLQSRLTYLDILVCMQHVLGRTWMHAARTKGLRHVLTYGAACTLVQTVHV